MSDNLMKGRFFRLPFPLLFFILSIYPLPSHSSNLYKYHQIAMGTVIEITLQTDDEEGAKKAALQAFQEIKRIEQLMSPWIGTSDVSRLNHSAGKGWGKVSQDTFKVIKRSQEISELSENGFDITIAPLTQL